MLAAANISLVTLNRDSSLTSLPSKLFNLMASGRPILAVAPLESELAQLIEETKCGVTVAPEQPKSLAEMIMRLKQEKTLLAAMGQQGRFHLETKFNRTRCVGMHEHMLLTLSCKRHKRHEEWALAARSEGQYH
jgi:colanic acid biosynthesis glycosyl transferase WcaI